MSTNPPIEHPVAALVAGGAAIIRAENDSQTRVAIERPRAEDKLLARALHELDLAPEEAALSYYSIPYREGEKDAKGKDKITHVEGLTINAANALLRLWGNCAVAARLVAEDATTWTLAGILHDHETNSRYERPFPASKYLRRRDGRQVLLTGRQAEAALLAAASKATRNVILQAIPAYIRLRYLARAKEIVAGSVKVPDILKAFQSINVTREHLEAHLDVPADRWTPAHVATLRGLYTAIREGSTTVADAFAPEPAEPAAGAGGGAVVTPDSLLGGAVTSETGVEPGEPRPAPPGGVSGPLAPDSGAPAAPPGDLSDRLRGLVADARPVVVPGPPREAVDPEVRPAAPAASETELGLARSAVVARMDRLKLSGPERALLIRQHAKVEALGAASLDGVTLVLDALAVIEAARKVNGPKP